MTPDAEPGGKVRPLPPDRIHLWSAVQEPDSRTAGQLWPILSPDERERANRLRSVSLFNRFVWARGLLRTLIGQYLTLPPAQIRFSYTAQGKPLLDPPAPLQFNLAHAEQVVLVGFTRTGRIGVDVESIRSDINNATLAAQFFAPSENAALQALPVSERDAAFYRLWTAKEAYLKAVGTGLSCPLNAFEFALTNGVPERILRIGEEEGEASRWHLQRWTPSPDFTAVVVTEGGPMGMDVFAVEEEG